MRSRQSKARPCTCSPRSVRFAFTLIEVLLIVVVLGIAGAMVIPSMAQANVLRVQASVRTLVSDITFLQSDAVAYQARRAVWFGVVPRWNPSSGQWEFVEGNGYSIAEVRGPSLDLSTDALADPENPSRPYGRDFDLPRYGGAILSNPSFNGGAMLIFDELGGPVAELDGPDPGEGGAVTIASRGEGSASATVFRVEVQAYTGRVRVMKVQDGGG